MCVVENIIVLRKGPLRKLRYDSQRAESVGNFPTLQLITWRGIVEDLYYIFSYTLWLEVICFELVKLSSSECIIL
jgi:hypothetical protein